MAADMRVPELVLSLLLVPCCCSAFLSREDLVEYRSQLEGILAQRRQLTRMDSMESTNSGSAHSPAQTPRHSIGPSVTSGGARATAMSVTDDVSTISRHGSGVITTERSNAAHHVHYAAASSGGAPSKTTREVWARETLKRMEACLKKRFAQRHISLLQGLMQASTAGTEWTDEALLTMLHG